MIRDQSQGCIGIRYAMESLYLDSYLLLPLLLPKYPVLHSHMCVLFNVFGFYAASMLLT